MEREEAINLIKQVLPCLNIDEKIREGFVTLIPELKESEDEKIRKELLKEIEFITPRDGETDGEGLILPSYHARIDRYKSYLEKQKEPEWCHYKVDLSGCSEEYRKAYYDGWNNCNQQHSQLQAEQKPEEWKPQPESLEALMYAIEGKWEMIKPTSYLSRRLEDLYNGLVNTFDVDESLVVHENDFVSKPANATQTDAKKNANAEWTEEDERILKDCIDMPYSADFISMERKKDAIRWLKSLRPQPHWKPSEEQMEILQYVCTQSSHPNQKVIPVLESLYNDLKKL